LPVDTEIAQLAKAVKEKKTSATPLNALLSQTRLDESTIIGSADAHLFWHLRFGREFLSELSAMAETESTSAGDLYEIINNYYAKARVEADTSTTPNQGDVDTALTSIASAVAALEGWAQLEEFAIWRRVQPYLPKAFENGGIIPIEAPRDWSRPAILALSCAIFLSAWEHLRRVSGTRARELVQTAALCLHDGVPGNASR
jgi:hypothetical protein